MIFFYTTHCIVYRCLEIADRLLERKKSELLMEDIIFSRIFGQKKDEHQPHPVILVFRFESFKI